MKTVLAGMKRKGNAPAGVTIRDAFSGKEDQQPDFGVPWLDFGARAYSPALRRWMVPDPLGEKHYGVNPYAYCNGDPVNYVDPEGQKVSAVFNRYTHTLYITDLDHYKKGLPEKYVSAREYQLGGVRDKEGRLIQNQVLVINNVFSGGQIENGKILRDVNDNRQIAIPIATYDIVDNNADTKHRGWFRLERQDNSLFNDKDDVTNRDGYRFHIGGLSWGCVTVDRTQDDAQLIWEVVISILNSTSTTIVSENRGKQWLNPFSKLIYYGTMDVIGEDTIPDKKE